MFCNKLCCWLLLSALVLVPASAGMGQDATDATTKAVSQVSDFGNSLVAKVKAAMSGNEQATQELLNDFFVPAAMALIFDDCWLFVCLVHGPSHR